MILHKFLINSKKILYHIFDSIFILCNSSWSGSVNDARVLQNSNIFKVFGALYRPYLGAVILGDSIYPAKIDSSLLYLQMLLQPQNVLVEADEKFDVSLTAVMD